MRLSRVCFVDLVTEPGKCIFQVGLQSLGLCIFLSMAISLHNSIYGRCQHWSGTMACFGNQKKRDVAQPKCADKYLICNIVQVHTKGS